MHNHTMLVSAATSASPQKQDCHVFPLYCRQYVAFCYAHTDLCNTLVYTVKQLLAVFREGQEGDNFYIIESGHFKVTKLEGHEQKLLFEYHDQGAFGELALMYNCPRAATVTVSLQPYCMVSARSKYCNVVAAG